MITMVPDTPDVEAVVFGANGIAEGLGPAKILIDMSSISPIATKKFAGRLAEKGCDWLDAPVSGGDVGARNATLSIMVGGAQAAFDQVKPILELMGRNITLVGNGRRRADRESCQSDHRGAHNRGGGRGAAVRIQGRSRSGEGASGSDGRVRKFQDS